MNRIKYRKPEELKDSGIEWLGMVPQEWKVSKLKYTSVIITGNTPPRTNEKNYLEGYLPWIKPNNILDDFTLSDSEEKLSLTGARNARLVSKNSSLVCCIGTIGKVALCEYDLTTNQQINAITFDKTIINHKYGFYSLISSRQEHEERANKVVVSILNKENQSKISILSPPLIEQQKIANFLDLKTAQFDSIISKKEQLIEKLEEAKKSLISEVVTGKVKIVDGKMVNRQPDEMIDSGVEWLGMIPKDWEVKKIKHISECYPSNVDKKTHPGEKPVRLCNYTDVYYNDYITSELEFMEASATLAQIKRFGLKKGDIILTKDSESPDDIGIATFVSESLKDLVCGYHLTIIKTHESYNPSYVYYQLLSTGVRNYFETVANGVTRYGINVYGFDNLPICIPSKKEQYNISIYLNNMLKLNSDIKEKTKSQIRKLKEAKQALISEAVTGKIDLRDWEIIEEGEIADVEAHTRLAKREVVSGTN